MSKKRFKKESKQRRVNQNCILANSGFEPYERCSSCDLKVSKCTGIQYNLFIVSVSMLLLLFIFIDNPLLIRFNIVSIIVMLVVMGYKVMVNSDEITLANFNNIKLTNQLKLQSESLQKEVLRQTKELKSLAIHDRLTGLYNRYEFELRLKNSLEDAQKNDLQHVLCYMDLDQFKIVNDTSGHVAGDELLKQLSNLLDGALDGDAFIARLGGDEFGIIIHESTIDDAKVKMENLLSVVRSYRFSWEDKLFRVGASIGMVPITSKCQSVNDLLVFADAACYTAKEKGRNRIHTYASLDESLVDHRNDMQWLEEIDSALEENRFELFGQEIEAFNGEDELTHFELLVRMRDRSGEIIEPMAFIPAAERYNKMTTVDRWVIQEAMYLLRDILNEGKKCQFSINLSGQSLGDDELPEYIKTLFIKTEIPYEYVCFEVTETAAISNLSKALVFIKDLKKLGCRFSLDDFGSGLSSFAYLKSIPVDYLKIDGQFIDNISTNAVNAQMVKAIHEIAGVMNIKTICEYVKNKETYDYLQSIGIDYVQGDYICAASSIHKSIAKCKSEKES